MSVSFFSLCISFECCNEGLCRNASGGNQLTTGLTRGDRERSSPGVLPDQHAGGRPRLHRSGQVFDVLQGQDLGQLTLERLERSEVRSSSPSGDSSRRTSARAWSSRWPSTTIR